VRAVYDAVQVFLSPVGFRYETLELAMRVGPELDLTAGLDLISSSVTKVLALDEIGVPPDKKVTVGSCISSLVVNERVTTLFSITTLLLGLSELMSRTVIVGAVVSIVTLLVSVTLVTPGATIPQRLLITLILKVTRPSPSFGAAV
jgi:hypothetical protein